jgi:outer membrane protein W
MKKKAFWCVLAPIVFTSTICHAESSFFSLNEDDNFKRYSISVGPLHVMPTGKAQAPKINTSIKEGTVVKNGDIALREVIPRLTEDNSALIKLALNVLNIGGNGTLPDALSGTSEVRGVESWVNHGAGMEAESLTTLGMMINYHFNDNISFESKLGIPPKVDIKGVGQIKAPFKATSTIAIGDIKLDGLPIYIEDDLDITDLESHKGSVATARAWTPMWELQYHFGQTGVNKFRPYVGLGLVVAYFNELELNPSLAKDLIDSGHQIANMKNGKAGDALIKGKKSSADPKIDLKAKISFAPIATLGFTYDFNPNWFAVASISYSHLSSTTTIKVVDDKLGTLYYSDIDLEVNPIVGYAGVGYRF